MSTFAANDQLVRSRLSSMADRWEELAGAEAYFADARTFPTSRRDKLAKEGKALSDGSYPIPDADALRRAAILAASGHGNVSAAKALIRKRAKELGVKLANLPGFGSSNGKESSAQMVECPMCHGSGKVPKGTKGTNDSDNDND